MQYNLSDQCTIYMTIAHVITMKRMNVETVKIHFH